MSGRRHRGETGRTYHDIPVHAGPGIHEFAIGVVRSRVDPGSRVLEVGTGSGAFAARLRDSGYRTTATDIDTSDFRGGTPVVAASSIASSPLATERFDLVVALEVVEHVDDPVAFLRDLHGALVPGGAVLLSTPNVVHLYSRLKFLVTGAPWLFGPRQYAETGHSTILPPWLLRAHLERAGFVEIAVGAAGGFDKTGVAPVLRAVRRVGLRDAVLGVADEGASIVAFAHRR